MKSILFFCAGVVCWASLMLSSIFVFVNFFTRMQISVNHWSVWLFSTSTMFILFGSFEPVKILVMEGKEKVLAFCLREEAPIKTLNDFLDELPESVAEISKIVNGVKTIYFRFNGCVYEFTTSIKDGCISSCMTLILVKGKYSKDSVECLKLATEELLRSTFSIVWGVFMPEIFLIIPDE